MVGFPPPLKLVDPICLDAMVPTACRILEEAGLKTNRQDLLNLARRLPGLALRENRITVQPEAVLAVIEQNRVENQESGLQPEAVEISVADRATLYADHHRYLHRPLLRDDLVKAAKMLHALGSQGVRGTTAGTPQDCVLPLQPLEQYLIGFRYNRNGGSTPVPVVPQARAFYFRMREIAEGFNPNRRSFSVWVPSPMRLEGNELDELLDYRGQVTRLYVGSMPVMGLTGPVDPLGVYTLSLAETLGGAAILQRLYPEAKVSFYPHPQPMDPRTGIMAFGTPEWNRLELIKKEIFEHLGLKPLKRDILTSAPMPDAQAQADKMASIAFSVSHGFTCFNLFTLSADEAWSPVQLLMDIEYVRLAWETIRPLAEAQRVENAFASLVECVQENKLFGEIDDSASRLRENYYRSRLPRSYSSSQWINRGSPDYLDGVEAQVDENIARIDYHPPEDQFRRVWEVYRQACREFGAEPMKIDG